MLKLDLFQTPLKSNLVKRCSGSSKGKGNQTSRPVRLSAYHQQRRSSKTKLFESDVVDSPWKKSSGSVSAIIELHQKIQKIITTLISKLEQKRRSLAQSYQQTELRAAQQVLGGWCQILSKQETKMTSSFTPMVQKQNPQKLQIPTQIRFRGATFSSIPSANTNFEMEFPIINISCASNSKSASNQTAVEKEFDVKSTTSMQIDIPEQQQRNPLTSMDRPPSNRLANLRPPPLKISKGK